MSSDKKVLIVTQSSFSQSYHEKLGRLPRLLRKHGYAVEWLKVTEEVFDFDNITRYCGIYFDGAAISANDADKHAWMSSQAQFMKLCVERHLPVLAICMSACLLTRVLGGHVGRHPSGTGERGYRKIIPTAEGCAFFSEEFNAYFWHQDGFSLPQDAVLLAKSALFNQAYCYKENCYALQFHPEWTPEIIRRYALTVESGTLIFKGSDDEKKQAEEGKKYAATIEAWFDNFLNYWPVKKIPEKTKDENNNN